MLYSLIIPVFNRPEDIEDLLACLSIQTNKNFEVIIVESGSSIPSDKVVEKYQDKLDIHHYMYKNSGQGFSRNYGMSKAKGDYFVILDSDILMDPDYVENLDQHLSQHYLDAFGGPDKAHDSFTNVQKAIDYTLTSIFTTGGIRGNKKHVGKFYPRSFNMGISREVYEKTNGFKYPYFGEDIDLSRRIMGLGYSTGLVEGAYVYHKRKTQFKGFYKQMFFFGRARIQLFKLFPDTLKVTHFFPAAFVVYLLTSVLISAVFPQFSPYLGIPLVLYIFMVFLGATLRFNSIEVGVLSIPALFTQMFGYGFGFIKDFVKRIIFKSDYKAKNKDNDDR